MNTGNGDLPLCSNKEEHIARGVTKRFSNFIDHTRFYDPFFKQGVVKMI